MSVKITTFGGVQLSGEEATRFLYQVEHEDVKQSAKESYARGLPMVKEFSQKGFATLNISKLLNNT